MDLVIRGAVIYTVLFVILRASGNRQFSELTAFDAVILIIISEATQQALVGDQDFSITAAVILIVTFVAIDIVLSHLKQWSKRFDLLLEGVPVMLVDNGKLQHENLRRERVDEADILEAARSIHGLERLDDVKHALLERNGSISIIPKK